MLNEVSTDGHIAASHELHSPLDDGMTFLTKKIWVGKSAVWWGKLAGQTAHIYATRNVYTS